MNVHPTGPAGRHHDRLPLRTPTTWPGRPAPVVLVVPDSLHAVAAARWAARAARHRGTDLALLVPVHCSFAELPAELADDARATAARALPAAGAHAVTAHAIAINVPRRASERAARLTEARAIAEAAEALRAPLVVVVEDISRPRGRAFLATLPTDVLFVPPTAAWRRSTATSS